jgi:hypothetical protein
MSKRTRRRFDAGLEGKVALGLRNEATVAELVAKSSSTGTRLYMEYVAARTATEFSLVGRGREAGLADLYARSVS